MGRRFGAMSSALLTDLYQLTMALAYWKSGLAEREAVFHLFTRKQPFGGGYTVACGQQPALDYLESYRFESDDLAYLGSLGGNDGTPLFDTGFLRALGESPLAVRVHAVPEGTVVFPHEPILRVEGPLWQCQLLETALLNVVNFQSLIATKAARICAAAGDEPVLEFGLRRAQGVSGAMAASRAAFVGGCAATSNVLAGQHYGIPVRGTHAHSWVMSFASEQEAFDRYADAMPNNCVFLVDTYDTRAGIEHAIAAGRRLRERGGELAGLDSGDLAQLSVDARRRLDEAGFPDAVIVASSDLDERRIAELRRRGAKIGVWGVGTRLTTAHDDPALGGVYKLAALRDERGDWRYRLKLSEDPTKISTPGVLQIWRFSRDGSFAGDVVVHEHALPAADQAVVGVDPFDSEVRQQFEPRARREELLERVFEQGRRVAPAPPLHAARDRRREQLARLPERIARLESPGVYPVGLEQGLFELRKREIARARAPVEERS